MGSHCFSFFDGCARLDLPLSATNAKLQRRHQWKNSGGTPPRASVLHSNQTARPIAATCRDVQAFGMMRFMMASNGALNAMIL
jgi:hypothetical protein